MMLNVDEIDVVQYEQGNDEQFFFHVKPTHVRPSDLLVFLPFI